MAVSPAGKTGRQGGDRGDAKSALCGVNGRKWITVALALAVTAGAVGVTASARQGGGLRSAGPLRRALWRAQGIRTAPLSIRVVDATTMQGLPAVDCVVGETGDRVETDQQGVARRIQVPILRSPPREEGRAEGHGRLTLLCYRSGYRDAIYIGVRMHEGILTEAEVWMHSVGDRDGRS